MDFFWLFVPDSSVAVDCSSVGALPVLELMRDATGHPVCATYLFASSFLYGTSEVVKECS
jgi:hypothetical protein